MRVVCRRDSAGQEPGVEAVDAFQDDELAFLELHHFAGLAAAEREVEPG